MKKLFNLMDISLSFSHTQTHTQIHAQMWAVMEMKINKRRDYKTACGKWQKENTDNALLLGNGVTLWRRKTYATHIFAKSSINYQPVPKIFASDLRHTQLLSSCLLCFSHLTWFPALTFPKNCIIDPPMGRMGIKHVKGTLVFHIEILRAITLGLQLTFGTTSLPLQLQL